MNNPARLLRCAAVGMLTLNLVGCASIVHSGHRPVTIDSDPQGALVTIADRRGEVVMSQMTPFTARLNPYGGYFSGQKYTATFDLAGYTTAQVPILPQMSPWYIGNIVFGGIIGFVIVDPLTGSMWDLRPLHINQALEKLPEPPAPAPPLSSIAPPPLPPVTPPVAPTESTNSPASSPPPASDATNSLAQPPPAPPEIMNPPAQSPATSSDNTNSLAQPPPSAP